MYSCKERKPHTHITRLGHSHTLVHGTSLQSTAENEVLILDLIELRAHTVSEQMYTDIHTHTDLVLHGFDLLRIQSAGSETKVCKLYMTRGVDQEVLSETRRQ